jgi:carboxypeptidase D
MPYLVSQTFLKYLDQVANACNYTSYLSKYLQYPPPPAPFPLPGASAEADPGCDVYTQIVDAALLLNPAFDVYRIFDMVCLVGLFLFPMTLTLHQRPILWDVLGFPCVKSYDPR